MSRAGYAENTLVEVRHSSRGMLITHGSRVVSDLTPPLFFAGCHRAVEKVSQKTNNNHLSVMFFTLKETGQTKEGQKKLSDFASGKRRKALECHWLTHRTTVVAAACGFAV